MSEIQDKLDSLQPYIVGIRYVQGLQVVDAVFKDKWSVPESDIIKKELVEEGTNYYMFYTEKEEVTFDDLLEYVEGIITINIEKEKKEELFQVKVKELQSVFKSNTLNKLSTLKFKFNESDSLPSLDGKEITLDEEIIVPEPVSSNKIEAVNEAVNDAPIVIEDKPNTTNIKGQEIELPPRGKVEVEEFEQPNIVCKCGPDEACPVCEEQKFG